MEKSLSIEQNKSFDKIRNVKWYLTLLYDLTIVLCLAGIVFSMLRPMDSLPGKWALRVGSDIIAMGICVALFKGCLTGRNSNGGIELNNVYFRYKNNLPYVVDGMNLKIRPGEYIVIVGRTGCR